VARFFSIQANNGFDAALRRKSRIDISLMSFVSRGRTGRNSTLDVMHLDAATVQRFEFVCH
jgi:hypothetical protein